MGSASQKILIIGGNRFFGKRLAQKLVADSHSVTLLNRQSLDDGLGSQVERIKCDRSNAEALALAVANKNFDLVYDQVCYQSSDAKAACEIFADRTSHYVFTSSQSVYEPGEAITEDAFNPLKHKFSKEADAKTEYAEAKRQCEAMFFAQNNFPVTAVRFTFVVGVDDYTGRLKWHVDRVKAGQEIFIPNTDAKIPLILSSDAAETLFTLGVNRSIGTFNASAPNPISLGKLIEEVEQTVGKKAHFAKIADDKCHSPYGVERDWYMSTEKLRAQGVRPQEIQSWLPELLRKLSV